MVAADLPSGSDFLTSPLPVVCKCNRCANLTTGSSCFVSTLILFFAFSPSLSDSDSSSLEVESLRLLFLFEDLWLLLEDFLLRDEDDEDDALLRRLLPDFLLFRSFFDLLFLRSLSSLLDDLESLLDFLEDLDFLERLCEDDLRFLLFLERL